MSGAGRVGAEPARPLAPFGRRPASVRANRPSGGYRVIEVLDELGPRPAAGQFYMLAREHGWGGAGERPYLPRAFSVAAAELVEGGVRLSFLAEDVGPGSGSLAAIGEGSNLLIVGPLGRPFAFPQQLRSEAAGAILVGGGIGVAPLAIHRAELARRGIPERTLLGFRDERHSGGLELFRCSEVRLASEDGHAGHRGYVTDLLAKMLSGDSAASAVVFACGPPAMLEAVRALCESHDVAAELAMESPMGCGFGACYGCAVPLSEGGYMRLCVDGPVVRADRLRTALLPGSGHR